MNLFIEDGVFKGRIKNFDPEKDFKSTSPGFRSRSVSATERRFPLKFEEFVQEKLMKSVNAAIIKVAQNFEQTLTLKSPETRSLEYQNFVLNANGDFISGTTFKL